MKLVVGLGNIGKRYANTRHNLGFMVVDELARRLQHQAIGEYNSGLIGRVSAPSSQPTWKSEAKLHADIATFDLAGDKVVLAKPATMMNLSGEAIQRIMQLYKIAPEHVWVVFDDVDVPFGRLRIRYGGGSGGHQGINSTIQHVGNQFVRLRTGISLNDRATEPSEMYVLKPFNAEEQAQLPTVIAHATSIIAEQLTLPNAEESTFDLLS